MTVLNIKDLHFTYPDGRRGLDGVTLAVEKGMRVALVGKNGSGKTTLLMHVPGLLDGEGDIEVCGVRMTSSSVREIRGMTALLFSQVEYQFIMPALLDDVMLGCTDLKLTDEERKSRALEWLKRFELEKYAEVAPLELSSGEMKRAALAALLVREPELLLMDEPLGNLDYSGARFLADVLTKLDTTMVFSSHHHFLVKKSATHIAVMEKGRVVDFMPAAEGLKKTRVRSLMY